MSKIRVTPEIFATWTDEKRKEWLHGKNLWIMRISDDKQKIDAELQSLRAQVARYAAIDKDVRDAAQLAQDLDALERRSRTQPDVERDYGIKVWQERIDRAPNDKIRARATAFRDRLLKVKNEVTLARIKTRCGYQHNTRRSGPGVTVEYICVLESGHTGPHRSSTNADYTGIEQPTPPTTTAGGSITFMPSGMLPTDLNVKKYGATFPVSAQGLFTTMQFDIAPEPKCDAFLDPKVSFHPELGRLFQCGKPPGHKDLHYDKTVGVFWEDKVAIRRKG